MRRIPPHRFVWLFILAIITSCMFVLCMVLTCLHLALTWVSDTATQINVELENEFDRIMDDYR